MSQRRVVITGLGWVTSVGLSIDAVWEQLIAGKSWITPITKFDPSEFKTRFASEIAQWDGGPHIDKLESKRMDRFAQYALNAAVDAVNDSGIAFDQENPWRCGAIVGSGIGGIETLATATEKMLAKGPGRVSPFLVPKMMCNAGSGNISIRFGMRGPNSAVATACASAAHAIGDATHAIRHNAADIMISGGSEAAVTPIGLASFVALKALSQRNDQPTLASRPFDQDRDGFVLAEGAGIIVLEEYEHAKARGANIYAEVLGFGQSADGSHITAPDPEGRGAAFAMTEALNDAKIKPDQIEYINAHGTSTPLGDAAETKAIKHVFGQNAYSVPISSTKSMTGHLLGASGGVEAIITAKSLQTHTLLPTINLDQPDEACDLDYIPNTARQAHVKTAMSNSFGFGGHNVSLVLGAL